jgi:thiamine pyrophosphate-dependent acetolactate synthase large subunit-like protein
MARTAAGVLADRLIDWGVRVFFGLPGDGINGIMEAMMLADGPALVEAIVDPFEPPMPPRVTAKQALHMAESLARGEPHRGRIALTLFRDKVSDLKGR